MNQQATENLYAWHKVFLAVLYAQPPIMKLTRCIVVYVFIYNLKQRVRLRLPETNTGKMYTACRANGSKVCLLLLVRLLVRLPSGYKTDALRLIPVKYERDTEIYRGRNPKLLFTMCIIFVYTNMYIC
jgi:hypothetical protein